jgi:hypothetical protein
MRTGREPDRFVACGEIDIEPRD